MRGRDLAVPARVEREREQGAVDVRDAVDTREDAGDGGVEGGEGAGFLRRGLVEIHQVREGAAQGFGECAWVGAVQGFAVRW